MYIYFSFYYIYAVRKVMRKKLSRSYLEDNNINL